MDALRHYPEKIIGSTMYFTRIDEKGNPSKSGKPYCTICSKMALDVGIERFVMRNDQGLVEYNTDEYNTISYKFRE
jgi:hypothetical protein